MATIKSHTDISQSRKLAEILPLESADMCWKYQKDRWVSEQDYEEFPQFEYATDKRDILCWSLAALIEEIPEVINFDDDESDYALEILKESGLFYLSYGNPLEGEKLNIEPQENFVDACVAMILKLHELNLL